MMIPRARKPVKLRRPVIRNPSFRKWKEGVGRKWRYQLSENARFYRDRKWSYKDRYENRNFEDYAGILGMTETGLTRKIKRMIQKRGKIRVLDLGCGQGVFLSELSQKFSGKVETEGLALRRPHKSNKMSKLYLGFMERFVKHHRYDVIFSVAAISYGAANSLIIQNICNSLRVGGTAYLEGDLPLSEYVKELQKQGIIIRKSSELAEIQKRAGVPFFERVHTPWFWELKRKNGAPIDLSMFYLKDDGGRVSLT